uniref:nicotinamide N-methyltransferase-like isoform X1 n=1 Tax=Euleptes europaea TaxID=460621 RepID=UPI002541562E|nr:nicotinamide N-methyltransferase-like isoform X1 [Euleptes europaea]
MAEFTGRDVYQAEFDSRDYLEYFHFGEGTLGDEALEFYLKQLCKTFASGRLKGDTLIDLGSGPTIYQFLSACESYRSIIASDPVDRNRQEIEMWVKSKPEAFDWTPVVKYVCELEGNRLHDIMEKTLIGKEAYLQHFRPQDYMKTYYSFNPDRAADNAFLTFSLKILHKAFILDGLKGNTLIDIGSGPSIHQFLSACESFQEIIATDYTDQNREEMQRWLKKEPGAFDWSLLVKYVCELEGDRERWAEKEEKVRRTIKQVLKCDVTQADPLAPLVVPPADCVLSVLCLETACEDLPTYRSAVKNIGSLVKPGGHLILVTALKTTFYIPGQNRFHALYLEQETVDNAVKGAGFDIVWAELKELCDSLHGSNKRGRYVLVAQKQQ